MAELVIPEAPARILRGVGSAPLMGDKPPPWLPEPPQIPKLVWEQNRLAPPLYSLANVPEGLPQLGLWDDFKTLLISDLKDSMDENYLRSCFAPFAEVKSVHLIRNKRPMFEGYGLIEFASNAIAHRVMRTCNNTTMPTSSYRYKLTWTIPSVRETADSSGYLIFVWNLTLQVTSSMLRETFWVHFPSVEQAVIVTDLYTENSRCCGFVQFRDPYERVRAASIMNNLFCDKEQMGVALVT